METVRQFLLQGFGFGKFFGYYKASFFKKDTPLLAVRNSFWSFYACPGQVVRRVKIELHRTFTSIMPEPVFDLGQSAGVVVTF